MEITRIVQRLSTASRDRRAISHIFCKNYCRKLLVCDKKRLECLGAIITTAICVDFFNKTAARSRSRKLVQHEAGLDTVLLIAALLKIRFSRCTLSALTVPLPVLTR